MVPLAHDLATRLPLTRQALAEGIIGDYKAQVIAEATRVLDDTAAGDAEAAVVPEGVTGKTPGQIRAAIGRAVIKADPDAARRRREEAEKDPRVELWREDAGTAAICGYGLPPDAALAADQAITTTALDLKAAGVTGTMDQLRARAYLDALLGQDSRPTAPQPAARQPRSPPPRSPPRRPPVQNAPAPSLPVRKPPARGPPAQRRRRPARSPPARSPPVQNAAAPSPPARKPPARRLPARRLPVRKPRARRLTLSLVRRAPARGPVLAHPARTAETAPREPAPGIARGRAETARPARTTPAATVIKVIKAARPARPATPPGRTGPARPPGRPGRRRRRRST